MSVDARRVIVALVAVVAVGIALRLWFVDALTKSTGTWIGGVDSPRRPSTRVEPRDD
jgi:hypothetical protein